MMRQTSSQFSITASYLLIIVFAVMISWLLHETAHYLTGVSLGYPMGMTMNKTFPLSGYFTSNAHEQLVSAAGPLMTIAEALIVFFLMRQRKRPLLYPFLFTCFYLRLMAGAVSFSRLNDEARISKSLGLSPFLLPVLVIALLGFLLYQTAREYKFGKRFNWITLVVIIVVSSAIVLSDQYLKVRIF